MDSHALDILEFDSVRRLLSTYASSSLGRELAERLEPGCDRAVISAELALVTEMVEELITGQGPSFGGLRDVRLTVRRAAIGTALTAEQLLDVAETLTCTGTIYRYRQRIDGKHQKLIDLLSGVEDLGGVAKSIQGCIDGRAHVLDMASPELTSVRKKLFDLEEKVKTEIKRLLRDPELRRILSYPNATVSGDHYVLPVAVNHRHKVPGVVHRVSGTGETIYVEPSSIAGLSAERMSLKAEEDREVKRVLRRLSVEVGRVSKPLIYSLDIIAKLDLVTAKAKFSREYGMFAPLLSDDRRLWLRSARHPLLQHFFCQSDQHKSVVPIDVRLGFGFNLLIITGPNTGGKTVALKTVGLLVLMAQAGLHIPASEGSIVPVFENVLVDIGDEQSLEQSLSTFSSHITRIAGILKIANEKSLVLLDELGAGTDPVEGAALGRAILDELDLLQPLAMVTTHLGDLKTFAFHNVRAENAAVEFDVETLRPTFRLLTGQFGMSNAILIARRLKLPKPLLQRARRYLKRRQGKGSELARLQAKRLTVEAARTEALSQQLAADQKQQELDRRQQELIREQELESQLNDWRQNLKAQSRVYVKRFGSIGTVVKLDSKRESVRVSVGLGQWDVPLNEVMPPK